ncbi:MAG: T9SS type A sorting domain-containing protein [Bacteroidota bacterium]|nr:T9SS type A sorting domain-containing protein [Bacteroidota bacterium]
MKKIYFSLLVLFSFNQFAQQLNNWDSVVVDGFGVNFRIRQMATFNNQLYSGLESPTASPAFIYSSSTGNMFDWSQTNFDLSAIAGDSIVNQLVTDPSTNGDLFVGVSNWQNGVSIYNYDGATWNSLSGATPPWGAMYNIIPKIFFYSASGGTDSVFIVIGNYDNLVPYQIWKSAKDNSSWSQVLTLPTGVYGVSDAIVYNDSIFFTTFNSFSMESFVYKCTNGSDTVRTHANPGITDVSNEFTGFGIFNNELYVGTYNWNAANMFRYSSANGWATVTSDGFGNGSSMASINKIYSFRKKLWVECTVQHGSFPMNRTHDPKNSILGGPISTIVFRSDDGINFTQSSPSGFYEYYNYGGKWHFTSLGTDLYAGGILDNGLGSQIYRLTVPEAGYTGNIGTTNVCQGTVENFTNTSSGATSYKWYVDGSLYSTQPNPSFTYSVVHTYTLALVSFSTDLTLKDSISFIKNVLPAPAITGLGTSLTICEGTTLNLGDYVYPTSGTAPFSYNWFSGFNTYTTANPSHFANISQNFTITIVDANGCAGSPGALLTNVTTSTDAWGHISTPTIDTVALGSGLVYAFKYQPGSAGGDTVDIAGINASGDYYFYSLDSGQYLIKAILDTAFYPLSVPTYYGNTFQWDSSVVLNHSCLLEDTVTIQVLEALTQTGPGAISGYIIEGVGFGTNRLNGGITNPNIPFAPGGPLKGVDVKLGKNPGGGIQARTMSDSTGFYVFDSLPVGGYKIYVDIPNLPMDSTREIIIAANDSSIQNNYFADSATIYVNTNIIGIYSSTIIYENKFSIYPNPAKENLSLSFELSEETKVSFELTNALGQLVMREPTRNYEKGLNIHSLNIESLNLNGGVYFISILSNNKKYTQRIIIIN